MKPEELELRRRFGASDRFSAWKMLTSGLGLDTLHSEIARREGKRTKLRAEIETQDQEIQQMLARKAQLMSQLEDNRQQIERMTPRVFISYASEDFEQVKPIYDNLKGNGLQRLKDMQRGTLNGSNTGITSPNFEQCWSLDPTNNWYGFREAATGSPWTLNQTRASNTVNEITGITNSVGATWTTPGYDAAGNTTAFPQPASPSNSYSATYDTWDRLVKLVATPTGDTVQTNQFDARNFRTVRLDYNSGSLGSTTKEVRIVTDGRRRCCKVWPNRSDKEYCKLFYQGNRNGHEGIVPSDWCWWIRTDGVLARRRILFSSNESAKVL